MTTIDEQVAAARERLSRAGIPAVEAALDARLLAQHVLGWSTATILTSGRAPGPDGFTDRYEALVRRRETREPLAYITGLKEFWGLNFEVTPSVLIPRPETESLVETILEHFRDRKEPLHIADLCTGSGCVAVAIAHELPAARVTATDISADALVVAARNVAAHHVDDRVSLSQADLLTTLDGPFDAIVANPPYVNHVGRPVMQREVRDFEPDVALFAGADGLDLIRRLIEQSASRLASNGMLIFEFGDGQEAEVSELISNSGTLTMVDVKSDLQGIARVAMARPTPPA